MQGKWDVTLHTELDKAMRDIAESEPDFVMISADHPNTHARLLVERLSSKQSFHVIMFAEKIATSSGMKIKASAGHCLNMPITASNFLRLIEKIETEKLKPYVKPEETTDQRTLAEVLSVTPPRNERDSDSHWISSPLNSTNEIHDLESYGGPTNNSRFILGTSIERAIEGIVSGGEKTNPDRTTTGNNAACLYVESRTFNGYLIAALGSNLPMDSELLHRLQTSLNLFLNESHQSSTTLTLLDIKLKSIPLADWAAYSNSLFKTGVHEGSELGIAFIPKDEVPMATEPGPTPDMITISVTDLDEGQIVDFELYHYLPNNQKYVKFSHRNMLLTDVQLARLKSKTQKMHLTVNDQSNLLLYAKKRQLYRAANEFLHKI